MDELVCYVPGTRRVINYKEDKKTGCVTPIYEVDSISEEYAILVEESMIRAMNEILSPLIDGQEIGKVSKEVGGSWAVK